MILIIGGAHQGKLSYAKAAFGVRDEDVYTCEGMDIDFSKRCIRSLEEFTFACYQKGVDPKAYLEEHREEWQNSILICRDIFCGVVPMDPDVREWRQITGRLSQYLTREAESVVRIFCGLEQRLK